MASTHQVSAVSALSHAKSSKDTILNRATRLSELGRGKAWGTLCEEAYDGYDLLTVRVLVVDIVEVETFFSMILKLLVVREGSTYTAELRGELSEA
jgi:hypothetical protein